MRESISSPLMPILRVSGLYAVTAVAEIRVYIGVAILWLWLIDGVRPTAWDLVGASVAVAGMIIIMLGPRHA